MSDFEFRQQDYPANPAPGSLGIWPLRGWNPVRDVESMRWNGHDQKDVAVFPESRVVRFPGTGPWVRVVW